MARQYTRQLFVGVWRPVSAQMWLYQRQNIRGGKLPIPSKGRPAI